MKPDVLDLFHPAVSRWFRESFAEPTPPQTKGWPRIASGEHTLILAPTGSGKTLAAFLYAIHELVTRSASSEELPVGVHTLYVSPLKALANDIERNLEEPLAGVRRCAEHMGLDLGEIRVGLRTGDTPASARRRMLKTPPHILITTPESLHLLLTSPRARDMLRTVEHVIVDEIHSLVPDKRGTFLSLLLERLEMVVGRSPTRIGLSATQRPLDLVARFLGGFESDGAPREVSIVDGGARKGLDLRVELPVEDMKALPAVGGVGPTIWPSIHQWLLDAVEAHASTLIFANNRRLVENVAAEMNRLAGEPFVRAHHGSVAREQRLEIEDLLKGGSLPALVATSSLELGIDIGAIDLVCQVETPVSVASALQRVGRSGHLYRATSKGRLVPKTRDDLLRMAGMAKAMRRGEISAARAPENPLDVLAQQIVAMVALDPWDVDELYGRVRQAYPYRELPRQAFESVLELVSGKYRSPTLSALRPRIAWDRARNLLEALPGARQAVVLNGGTIPETGQYPMVLEDGKTKLGELDEEFVFERRLGQTILLGTSRWTILEIGTDRVVVAPSEETEAVMPFWKGEGLGHDAEFGRRLGEFIRACGERAGDPAFEEWLAETCALDARASKNLATYVRDQIDKGTALPDDRTVLFDAFRSEAGDPRLALLTPFGRAFHLALLLALQGTLRAAGLRPPQAVFSNAGILLRPGGRVSVDEMVSAFRSLTPETLTDRILEELEETPYFALRFRRNAARALLLPRARPGRRTPLWLQRLRAHDLLDYAKDHETFPIIAETYREILEDVLPLPEVKRLLGDIVSDRARLVVRSDARPSPFSSSLLRDFTAGFFYEEDVPAPPADGRRTRRLGGLDLSGGGEKEPVLETSALRTLEERLQGIASYERARDGVELVDMLRRIGDLTERELADRCEPAALAALQDLIEDGRVVRVGLRGDPDRLVVEEDVERYGRLAASDVCAIVLRFASGHAGVTRQEIEARYPGSNRAVEELLDAGDLVEFSAADGGRRIAAPDVVAAARRMTLAAGRRRVRTVPAEHLVDALLQRQHVTAPVSGEDGLREVLDQLAGWFAPIESWPSILGRRVEGYRPNLLEEAVRGGAVAWRGRSDVRGGRAIGFAPRALAAILRPPRPTGAASSEGEAAIEYLATHGASYLHEIAQGADLQVSEAAGALWDSIWEGRVTNDSLAPALSRRPGPDLWRGRSRSGWGGGRWSLFPGEDCGADVEDCIRILLHRCGLLCRGMVERESLGVRWREVYPILTRMEWRGDVERGLFVDGLSAPQFVAPGFAASLRAERSTESRPVLLGALDPAFVWGDVLPIFRPSGDAFPARHHPGNHWVIRDGRPILAIEGGGERLTPLVPLEGEERFEALSCLPAILDGPGGRPSFRVRTWDGIPIDRTPAAADLERIGFMREDAVMILYRDFGVGG